MGFLDTIRGRSVTSRDSEVQQALTPEEAQEQSWRAQIARNEWVVLHEPARRDGTSPAFQYTAGLTERGLPEVVVYGLRMKTGTLVLDDLAWRLLDGEQLDDGVPVPGLVHGDDRAQLWDVTWLQDHLDAVLRLYGTVARVRQLVVCDPEGRLPWEDGFSAGHLEPVLFTPPNGRGPRRTDPAPSAPVAGPSAGLYSFDD